MFNKKQLYFIGSLALVLSLVLAQVQVKAAWTNPGGGPGGTTTNPPLTNPLNGSLNLNGWDISSASSTASTDITGIHDLQVTNNLTVTKINNQTPVFGGGIKNPLEANLSGNNLFGVEKLMGCDPTSGRTCSALEGQAGKSTRSDSFALGVYGYTQAISGSNPSYGVYGLAQNLAGVGVYGYATEKNAYGVYGVARDKDSIGGSFRNLAVGGKALVTSGLTELNGNLNVIGNADVSNMLNGKDAVFSGTMEVTGATTMEGFVIAQNGLNVQGPFRVDISPVSLNSAIVGNANGTNYNVNAGVEGQGTVGVYGDGHLVGIFGTSPGYGGIFKGYTATGWGPPPGGGMDNSGIDTMPNGFITKLFGIEKTWAGLEIAGAVGLVAAGGWQYDGSFTNAGLGICALSGEKAHYVDTTGNGDFQAYCKSGTANNFSGFFAGDIYVKDGSIQFNDTLGAAGENLIYGNIGAASAVGSHLIKLQTNGSDKFKVDRAGNAFLDGDLDMDDLIVNNITSDDIIGDTATFQDILLAEDGILAFDTVGKNQPTCLAETEGYTYYFQGTKALCICTGSSWKAMINSQVDSACR